jgi:multidrug resistance efflux pump
MMPSSAEFVINTDAASRPGRRLNWIRVGKLSFVILFLLAAAYFATNQILTTSSLEGTVTSPLVTLRAPIDGRVSMERLTTGQTVAVNDTLISIDDPRVDNRPHSELQARLAGAKEQASALAVQAESLSQLIAQLTDRSQQHRKATIARIERLMDEARAQYNSAKAVTERTQDELRRQKTLAGNGYAAQTKLEDANLAGQQAKFEAERLLGTLGRLAVEWKAAQDGIMLGEGYSDAPYSQQRIDELAVRLIELKSQQAAAENLKREIASRLDAETEWVKTQQSAVVTSPIAGTVWTVNVTDGALVSRNAPLAQVVDCRSSFIEATLPESSYDEVGIGDPVKVHLVGNSRGINGIVRAVRGQSAVVDRDGRSGEHWLAAWLVSQRSEAMTVTIEIDRAGLEEASRGLCQVGRTAKVHFEKSDLWNKATTMVQKTVGKAVAANASAATGQW